MAFVLERITILTDQALQMSDDLGGRLFRYSEGRRNQQFQHNAKAINAVLHAHSLAGQTLIEARVSGADPYQALDTAMGWEPFLQSVEAAQQLSQPESFDYLDQLDPFYSAIRRYTPTFLDLFEFKGTQATQSLRQAIEVIQQRNAQEHPQALPLDAPTDFIKPRWEPYVFTEDGTLNHRYYEFCVLYELCNQLRSGDVWVSDSRQFKDFDDDLIAPALWTTLRQTNTVPVAVETDFQTYRLQREQLVQRRMREVNDLLAQGLLPGVSIRNGRLHIKRLDALEVPEETEQIAQRVHQLLPQVRVTEVLEEVFGWIPFSQCFTHAHSGEGASDVMALLAVILGEALNLSLDKMTQACSELDASTLVSTAEWYLREETYAQALTELVNYHHHLPFVAYWGDGTTSASDAQFFAADGPRSALAHISRHYGFQPGILAYTHYSDQHEPYHIALLSPHEHQAPYVVDGLVAQTTELDIHEHYTDIGGFSDHTFAFCHLLGYRFAPRLRDFHKKRQPERSSLIDVDSSRMPTTTSNSIGPVHSTWSSCASSSGIRSIWHALSNTSDSMVSTSPIKFYPMSRRFSGSMSISSVISCGIVLC